MIDLLKIEEQTLSGLKDFQRATVNRIYELFTKGNNRVLVADEVGLGKTLVARGTIARMARYHNEVLKDDLFKVVYICSNQNIASQNINKLKVDKRIKIDDISSTRLSMQHLKIFKDQYGKNAEKNYIQLIPLTPTTSFNMTSGTGTVRERALMFAILKRYRGFERYANELGELLRYGATVAWDNWARVNYEDEVVKCNEDSKNLYLKSILEKVDKYFDNNKVLYNEVLDLLKKIRKSDSNLKGNGRLIQKLRKVMAEISVELMNPDLVIMDEFQKFKELLDIEDDSETAILSRKFFNSKSSELYNVKILLLSATPYKLYSTSEEINQNGSDDHYKEFIQVNDFINEENKEDRENFRNIWSEYSKTLNNISEENFEELIISKNKAEEQLYKGICRTERMVVKGADSILDVTGAKNLVNVTENDIMSYVQMERLLEDIELNERVPIEYVKSAPYVMSFMDKYKLKENIFNYFYKNKDSIKKVYRSDIWIDKRRVSKYKEIPMGNSRLEKLKEESLSKNAEKLLWIPPSRPYYELMGAFKGQENFSKVLVFSSWEMVPRSIAAMISYEAERLTIGKLFNSLDKNDKQRKSYFNTKTPFPTPRLVFRLKEENPATMNTLCMVYPSITLAKLFNPIDVINRDLSYREIKNEIIVKLKKLLISIESKYGNNKTGRVDDKWYYVVPLLLDQNEEATKELFNNINLITTDNSQDEDKEQVKAGGVYLKHFESLKAIFNNLENLELGKQPDDLINVLVDMILGSASIAMLRLFNEYSLDALVNSIKVGKSMIDKFNSQEAIAIVELQYGEKNDDAHWQNVLKYCRDGNIQSVFDEYAHMLIGANDLGKEESVEKNKRLAEAFIENIKIQTASYNVDTYESFKSRVLEEDVSKAVRMRSSYAVGFYDTKINDKSIQRKESIRQGFNSPFRPFVLATTSIGQEGLDFHNYCRKIVHWNLPSNPVDIEQREGRINRYKCLAIRKNISKKFGYVKFKEDIWEEMFLTASKELKRDGDCDLIPFWCIPECDGDKIERIVPSYPYSKDIVKYERLMKILNIYRLSLGQARQEELMEYILDKDLVGEKVKELFMNLSPYYRNIK